MAVLVEIALAGATQEQVDRAEVLAMERGQQVGGPPYPGCIFVAVVPHEDGLRFASAWRTETAFRATYEAALQPDLAAAGMTAGDPVVSPVLSMAVPGVHAA